MPDETPTGRDTAPVDGPRPDGDAMPTAFGRYRILSRLGEGGMGAVYLAEQENPSRKVALKVIRPGRVSPAMRQRFRLESQILGWLTHANVAAVYDAGEADGQPYFAMEYVEGSMLGVYADAHPLTDEAKLELFAKICDGVAHAHQRGVIHRDLKPANVLVTAGGTPKVVDFGVARVTDPELAITQHTDIGQIVGTLWYMAPEQAAGDPSRIGPPADVYALGVILYELLCDELPLDLRNKPIPEVLDLIQNAEPVPLEARDRRFRGDVSTIVGKALQKDPSRRYDSAAALADDVRRSLQNQPIVARPTTSWYLAGKFVRRNRPLVLAGSVAALALLVGTGVAVYGLLEARGEAKRANAAALVSDAATLRANDEAANAKRLLAEQTYLRAQVDRDAGRFRPAIEGYRNALALGYPDEVRTQLRILDCHTFLMEAREATALSAALSARPDLGGAEAEVLLVSGLIGLEAGQPVRGRPAVEAIRKAIAMGLPPEKAAFARGMLAPTVPEMLVAMTEAVRHDPALLDAQIYRILSFVLLGRLREADRALVGIETLFEHMPQILALRWLVSLLNGDVAEANRAETKLAQASPELAPLLRLGGKLYRTLVSPEGPDVLTLLDMALSFRGALQPRAGGSAVPGMAEHLGHVPAFAPFAQIRFSNMQEVLFDPQAKFRIADQIHAVAPSSVTHGMRGVAAYNQGRHADAAEEFRRGAEISEGGEMLWRCLCFRLVVYRTSGLAAPPGVAEDLVHRLTAFAPLPDNEDTLEVAKAALEFGEFAAADRLAAGLKRVNAQTFAVWRATARGKVAEAGQLADELAPRMRGNANAMDAVRAAWADRAKAAGKPEPLLAKPRPAKP